MKLRKTRHHPKWIYLHMFSIKINKIVVAVVLQKQCFQFRKVGSNSGNTLWISRHWKMKTEDAFEVVCVEKLSLSFTCRTCLSTDSGQQLISIFDRSESGILPDNLIDNLSDFKLKVCINIFYLSVSWLPIFLDCKRRWISGKYL